jgi:DNA invertase Pin-like site-specific DNA recombinase
VKPKKVALYARVSTDLQTTDNQLAELRATAQRNGWSIVAEYIDNGISGAKGRNGRPQFDAMIRAAMRREFDLIAAWSVDRLGRSLQDLVEFLNEIHAKRVDLYLHQQGIDTTTPAGRALFQMCGVFAEFERSIMQERIRAGLARARTYGTRSGRPLGRPKVSEDKVHAIRALAAKGIGKRKAAGLIGVGVGTVQRVLREARPPCTNT